MKQTVLTTTLAAAALAFALSACDQQQADSGSAEPLQQQGAVPAGPTSAPQATDPAAQPEPLETTPESPLPAPSSDTQ